jgi:ABC-type transporter Mla subunit MlaD
MSTAAHVAVAMVFAVVGWVAVSIAGGALAVGAGADREAKMTVVVLFAIAGIFGGAWGGWRLTR